MPLENDLDKVLIIGSGPTLIGSVAEMDLLATDAIKALNEDGVQVVLVNPNPATIASDKKNGVTVYLEPMSLDFLKRILRMEQPDAILSSFGSTTALSVTQKLLKDGILQEMGIKLLGINSRSLTMTKSRERTSFLKELGLEITKSWEPKTEQQQDLQTSLLALNNKLTFPILVTKYHHYVHNEHTALNNEQDLYQYFEKENQAGNFSWNNYRLTEDLSSWEEIIVDLIRDQTGNIVFTNIASSIEPIAINSGDSALVTPCLTLNNDQIIKLRHESQLIADNLNLVGPLSLHFAIKHQGIQIITKVLSLKPRLTRSSLLAQRVGLYSIGYITAKVCLGYNLNEINDPDSNLNAAIEPVLDAVAVKMPYFSFTEAGNNHYYLNDRMQASGEALGIGRNFETAFLKALASTRGFKISWTVFQDEMKKTKKEILADCANFDEHHLIKVIAGIAKGISYDQFAASINLHPVYFQKLQNLVAIGRQLSQQALTADLLLLAKKCGFSNQLIAVLSKQTAAEIAKLAKQAQVSQAYIQIDGSAGIYRPAVKAFYSAYGVNDEDQLSLKSKPQKRILVIGMLPLQASVTSEFDYMLAHALQTLKQLNYQTILLSNNAESISASYHLADRIYFDPINLENILNLAHKEKITEVLVQFSGKKVSALRQTLTDHGLHIFGQKQAKLEQNLKQQPFTAIPNLNRVPELQTSKADAIFKFVARYGFPVLVSGQNDNFKQKSAIIYELPVLKKYLQENKLDTINISQFISGRKYEITAISDGEEVTIPGIIEHLEQSGSHASDSIAVFQPQNLGLAEKRALEQLTIRLIEKLKTSGLFNLHFLIVGKKIYLLQIKPYAGHNVAFLSKAIGKNITNIACQVLASKRLKELGLTAGLWPSSNSLIHVKMPVFSFVNYHNHNSFDSHMKSSGSVMGRDTELAKALYKGYEASDLHIPSYGTIFVSVRDQDKKKITALAKRFDRLGFKLVATEGTATMFAEAGITTGIIEKVSQDSRSLLEKIKQHKIVMVINITNLSDTASKDAIQIRDQALNTHVPVFSSIETTELILKVLESLALTTQPI